MLLLFFLNYCIIALRHAVTAADVELRGLH